MLDYTDFIIDGALETQLKLKMMQASRNIGFKGVILPVDVRKNILRTFLKIIYSINLKKVMSGKPTNRIVLNYFKKFLFNLDCKFLNSNKNTLDLNYNSTLILNSLYEICSDKFDD
jgi:hypothetical protein